MSNNCRNCHYLEQDTDFSHHYCRRYPEKISVTLDHLCGEFTEKYPDWDGTEHGYEQYLMTLHNESDEKRINLKKLLKKRNQQIKQLKKEMQNGRNK